MAYIRKHQTKQRARGKPVYTYAVVWRANINGRVRLRQRSFATREAAEEGCAARKGDSFRYAA
jgi:hypothetical protein